MSRRRSPVTVRVHYPLRANGLAHGRLVLRADPDWVTDIEAVRVSPGGSSHDFVLPPGESHRYFKPVWRGGEELRWAAGANSLLLSCSRNARDIYPYFDEDARCSECELKELTDATGRVHRYRAFYPAGYWENPLRRYRVLYMQDGQNLFFPGEAFGGNHWRIAETLRLLEAMNAIEPMIVVGVYPGAREQDYTQPGYENYGRFVTELLKPAIDAEYRTLTGAEHTAVMGSSLGGVVSLYLAWEYPDVFGMAACLSSTFGWRDNLRERIAREPRRKLVLYLDSGWPRDNYEVTRDMHALLARRGYRPGRDLHYLSFPEALHDEYHWAMRAHIPFQHFFGQIA